MRKGIIGPGCLLCLMMWFQVQVIETLQMHMLDEQGRQLTKTDRLLYPRITHHGKDLWDSIRYHEEDLDHD